jgi:hypothetical protein
MSPVEGLLWCKRQYHDREEQSEAVLRRIQSRLFQQPAGKSCGRIAVSGRSRVAWQSPKELPVK